MEIGSSNEVNNYSNLPNTSDTSCTDGTGKTTLDFAKVANQPQCSKTSINIKNTGFESPYVPNLSEYSILDVRGVISVPDILVPGWKTTSKFNRAVDNKYENVKYGNIEIWGENRNVAPTIEPHSGVQFAEINGNAPGSLYQDLSGFKGNEKLMFGFSHRARPRAGLQQVKIVVGKPDHSVDQFSSSTEPVSGTPGVNYYKSIDYTAEDDWVTNFDIIDLSKYTMDFSRYSTLRVAISSGDNSDYPTVGNFIDDIYFSTPVIYDLSNKIVDETPSIQNYTKKVYNYESKLIKKGGDRGANVTFNVEIPSSITPNINTIKVKNKALDSPTLKTLSLNSDYTVEYKNNMLVIKLNNNKVFLPEYYLNFDFGLNNDITQDIMESELVNKPSIKTTVSFQSYLEKHIFPEEVRRYWVYNDVSTPFDFSTNAKIQTKNLSFKINNQPLNSEELIKQAVIVPQDVINLPEYEITSNYGGPFTTNGDHKVEIIVSGLNGIKIKTNIVVTIEYIDTSIILNDLEFDVKNAPLKENLKDLLIGSIIDVNGKEVPYDKISIVDYDGYEDNNLDHKTYNIAFEITAFDNTKHPKNTSVTINFNNATLEVNDFTIKSSDKLNFQQIIAKSGVIATDSDSKDITSKILLDINNYNSDSPQIKTYNATFSVTGKNNIPTTKNVIMNVIADKGIINASDLELKIKNAPTSDDDLIKQMNVTGIDVDNSAVNTIAIDKDLYSYDNTKTGTYEIKFSFIDKSSNLITTTKILNIYSNVPSFDTTNKTVKRHNAPTSEQELINLLVNTVVDINGKEVTPENIKVSDLNGYNFSDITSGTYDIEFSINCIDGNSYTTKENVTVLYTNLGSFTNNDHSGYLLSCTTNSPCIFKFETDSVPTSEILLYKNSTLPNNLKLNSNGELNGSVSKEGIYNFDIVSKNEVGTTNPINVTISVSDNTTTVDNNILPPTIVSTNYYYPASNNSTPSTSNVEETNNLTSSNNNFVAFNDNTIDSSIANNKPKQYGTKNSISKNNSVIQNDTTDIAKVIFIILLLLIIPLALWLFLRKKKKE